MFTKKDSMKQKLITSLALLLLSGPALFAQAQFTTIDSIDVNHINAAVLVHGDMWWNPVTSTTACFFPKGTHKNISFAAGLWMSGYDNGGQLHIAAQTYRQHGNDYWPGPLDNNDTLTYATSQQWAKIWKVYRSEVQYMQSLTTFTAATVPASILTWPGTGNVNATGNGGVALTVSGPMAPFVDLNGNGIYEPLMGEYPDFNGEEALWWVFSDNGATHGQTGGKPLGVEVHALAYAYNRGTDIDNVVFYNYRIVNKSSNTYTNFRVDQYADMDLGYFGDDFIGCDTTRSIGIVYNGNNDDGVSAGHPANSYGASIPIAAVKLMPFAAGFGNFTYFNNDASVIGNPVTPAEYNNYMRGRLRDSTTFTDDFTGGGSASHGYGSGPVTHYVYTGDPANSAEWSECVSGNVPGDRRFLVGTGDFSVAPGSVTDLTFALITTNPDTINGCPGAAFDSIKAITDYATSIFDGPLPPPPAAVGALAGNDLSVSIYPNPAHDKLFVECAVPGADAAITIYNAMGRAMPVAVAGKGARITVNIASLPAGVYYLQYRADGGSIAKRFVKD